MADQTITIIIPVYNAAATLGRCVDSILAQTVQDWRLILVDDGSHDNSGEICNRYQRLDPRIVALHKKNGGAGSARNFGLEHCSTDWVTFIDADDTIEPDYLQNFRLDKNIGRTDVVIMQGFRRVSPDMKPLGEEINLKTAVYKSPNLLSKAFSSDRIFEYGQSVGKLYSMATIRRHHLNFPDNFSLSEDHYFYLSFMLKVKEIVAYSGTRYNYIWEESAGLSRKQHPYPQLLERYMALTGLCNQFKSIEKLESSTISQIDYFATTGSLSLLLQSLFRQEPDKKIRLSILSQVLTDKDFLRSTFHPHNIKGKVVKSILIGFPISVSQFLLSKFIK